MDFLVRNNDGSKMTLSGETLASTIERYIHHIARSNKIGNEYGYQLEQVYMEYSPDIFDGKGGAVLTILSYGKSVEPKCPPENTPLQTTRVWVSAKPEELPERYYFDFDDLTLFNPFTFDPEEKTPEFLMGVLCALMDRIIEKYLVCDIHSSHFSLDYSAKHPTVEYSKPLEFLAIIHDKIIKNGIKKCPESDGLMKRIATLMDSESLGNHLLNGKILKSKGGADIIAYYKTQNYFNSIGQQNRLKYYRKKNHLTQSQVAESANMNVRTYQRFESGERLLEKAEYQTIQNLAQTLKTTPSVLMGTDYIE